MRNIADMAGCHIDTIFRIKRGSNRPSPELAKKLEDIVGVDRRCWLWPEDFGNPWDKFYSRYK